MKEKKLLLVLMALLLVNHVSARPFSGQEVVGQDILRDVVVIDSLDLPILTEEFYHNVNFFNRQFDYEATNRISRLKMWSREVMTAGYVTLLGLLVGNAILAINNDWSLWIDIPCATVVGIACMYPFILWSNHLDKKAEYLSSQTVYLYNINSQIDLGATRFTNHGCSLQAIGIGIKVNF